MRMEELDLDRVLRDIGGNFGKYQLKRYFLYSLLLIWTAFPTLSYVFTTRNLKYRCFVKGCDDKNSTYHANWLHKAVPFMGSDPSKCFQFTSSQLGDGCNATLFNRTATVKCNEYIHENKHERTIANEFGMMCDDDMWMLTIVGTINNAGFLVGLPLSGYVSDRYGRRVAMIATVLGSTLTGFARASSSSYIFFIVLEFLDQALGSGAYSAAYIMGMESVTSQYRVAASTCMSCSFAFGAGILGFVAWGTLSWRKLLWFTYMPGLIFISYWWIIDESVRWLLSKNRNAEAAAILSKIAKENNRVFNSQSVKHLNVSGEKKKVVSKVDSFGDVIHSNKLLLRLLNCSFTWLCCTFVYYGLTLHSVGISGNVYINFIAVSLIEIPAYVAANFALTRLGRKTTLSASLILSGAACIGFVFTPEGDAVFRLILFLFGKFSVTVSYAAIYLYTTEMFPTSLRHSFMSFCSTLGRLGSMIAPQIPLLAAISKSLPLISFAAMATTAGLLSLIFPETLNKRLPDTIKEAENIETLHVEKL